MNLPVSSTGKRADRVAQECAEIAGQIIRASAGEVRVTAKKGRGNLVTATDFAVERAVREHLSTAFAEHAILSEETAADVRSEGWMWVVDPLDGTKNFSRGIPHFCFSIALCHNNIPQLGLIHHPLLGETFGASRGGGTTLNGSPVHVSDASNVRESVVAIDLGYHDGRAAEQLALAGRLWPGMQALRVAGSAALGLAFTAAGRWDLFVHRDLQPWDSAAGILLVEEAGGVVTTYEGRAASIFDGQLVAGGPAVHADFLRLAANNDLPA